LLKLKVRLCTKDRCIDTTALANSGFIGWEPEVLMPQSIASAIFGRKFPTVLIERILADGSKVLLPRAESPIEVYVVAEDRTSGPVQAYAYISRGGLTLLNDKLLGKLGIAIVDPGEGLWCFRDELGRISRRSY